MTETNGGISLKWAQFGILIVGQLMLIGAAYGVLKFEVEDHARRLADIERKQDANFIPRSEYDKRHTDLQEQLREIRDQLRELQRKAR